jgi:hypothetical protein
MPIAGTAQPTEQLIDHLEASTLAVYDRYKLSVGHSPV